MALSSEVWALFTSETGTLVSQRDICKFWDSMSSDTKQPQLKARTQDGQ